jgi:excisionase family DNA binding protein
MRDYLKELLDSIPAKPLFRVDEVAELFRVSKRTIYNWIKDDTLKGTTEKGTLRIYRSSLVEIIMKGRDIA